MSNRERVAPCLPQRQRSLGGAVVVFLEIMLMPLTIMMIMMTMPLTASPKGQPRHRHSLPKGMVTASSPLTVASRRRPTAQESSICTEENTDTHSEDGH